MSIAGLAALVVCSSGARSQVAQSIYGYDFVTIGDAGNRDTIDSEINPLFPGTRIGGVGYEYRMATTEVTIGQYFEFVQAYLPHYTARTGDAFGSPAFTGTGIDSTGNFAFIRGGFSPGRAANMSWEYAARYVNWLHNGKGSDVASFETGVYDTSTFTQNPDGSWNHQATHNPDAKFWMPTWDEWTKAGYWDPAKNGGEGGYWKFQNGSDVEPIPGLLPEDGGERNASHDDPFPLDVGSFTNVTSPWGLFDMAGGEREWSETVVIDRPSTRNTGGSRFTDISYGNVFSTDIIGQGTSAIVNSSGFGLRLASAVPGPPGLGVMGASLLLINRRRR